MERREVNACLIRMQQGDHEAFAALYEGCKRGVFAVLYPYYHSYSDTEDAMQSVFLRVKENILKYRPDTDARSWLLTVARNYALNDIKRKKREELTEDSVLERLSVGSPIPEGGAFDALNRALNEEERRVVVLHVFWGYKHRETAKLLSMPLGTVTSKYKTAIAKMRKFLEEVAT